MIRVSVGSRSENHGIRGKSDILVSWYPPRWSAGILICLIILSSAILPVTAELSSANYKIPALVLTAGGATELSSTNYKLTDSKGFYGGVLTDGMILQLGGVFVIVPFGAAPIVPLQITTDTLPAGVQGTAYSRTLAAVGGTPPYNWSIISDVLPPGLTLNAATGNISGAPTLIGTYNFRVRVTDSAGGTAEKNLSIDINPSIPDIPYGPQISVSVLFQSLANISTFRHPGPMYVRVEARNGATPGTATRLIGYADVILNQGGNTVGRNGFLKPDGTEFGAATPMRNGDYYVAVKQWLTPSLVGIGHLSVISNRKLTFRSDPVRDAATTWLDLTNNPLLRDDPVSRVYKETPYKPAATKPNALVTIGGRTMMRAGDLNGNNYVDVIDTSDWYRLFQRFNARGAGGNDPADPYIRADLDQNGLVDVIDTSWWYGTFNNLSFELNDPGPHGYVPAIVP